MLRIHSFICQNPILGILSTGAKESLEWEVISFFHFHQTDTNYFPLITVIALKICHDFWPRIFVRNQFLRVRFSYVIDFHINRKKYTAKTTFCQCNIFHHEQALCRLGKVWYFRNIDGPSVLLPLPSAIFFLSTQDERKRADELSHDTNFTKRTGVIPQR